jgi:hypothetical protein
MALDKPESPAAGTGSLTEKRFRRIGDGFVIDADESFICYQVEGDYVQRWKTNS